jgi:hypothetical protein
MEECIMVKFNIYAVLGIILLVTTIIGMFKNLIDKYRDDFGGGVNLVITIITIIALFASLAAIVSGIEGNVIAMHLESSTVITVEEMQELQARLMQCNQEALIGIITGYIMITLHYALFHIKKPLPSKESRWDYSKVIY